MKKALLIVALLAVLGGPGIGATQEAAKQATVTLDFFATTDDGETAPKLTPADLTLKVGGKTQGIQSVEAITPNPRHIVLIVDEATLYSLEPIAKDAIAKLLASLRPSDMVGFFSTRLGGQVTSLTTQRERITTLAANLKTGPGVLYPCQRDLMTLIGSYAADVPSGRATSIAVISRGHPEGPSMTGDSDAAPCTPRREDLRKLEEALAVAQVNFHLFTVTSAQRAWGFDNIAGNTGGTSDALTWANQDALARAIQSTATFYRITFTPDGSKDRVHRVELRGKGLKIRTSPVLRFK